MILTVGGIKGGSGKSTLATHLAVLHSQRGYRVILVDADEQGTSYDFTQLRADRLGSAGYTCTKLSGRGVLHAVRDLAAHYDAVIVDTGGRDSASQRAALLAADTAIFPFVPRPYDVWTLDDLAKLLAEIRDVNTTLNAFTYLNRAEVRGAMVESTRAMLETGAEHGIAFSGLRLGSRMAFASAAGEGLAVTEYKPRDQQAVDEINLLHGYTCGFYLRHEGRTLKNEHAS